MASKGEIRTYDGREVRVTNPGKVLFPDDGITKGDVLDYVVRCQEPLLAALRGRPLSMERRVDGLASPGFFHKHKPAHFPDWVRTFTSATSKGPMEQVVVDDLATLVLVTNFGCLTPHVPTIRVDRPFHPDQLVFDLDPSTDDVGRVREAARCVRSLLDERGATSFLRWTGSRGIHVLVPLDRSADGDEVMRISHALGAALCERHPSLFTSEFHKSERKDRIYLDIARNHPGATCVASWAIRPKPGAPVAMPIAWEELDDTGPRTFTLRSAPDRLGVDPWGGFEEARIPAGRMVRFSGSTSPT